MTVREVIEMLQTMPKDAEVVLADHPGSIDASPCTSVAPGVYQSHSETEGTLKKATGDARPNAVALWPAN